MLVTLRDYQKTAVDNIRQSYINGFHAPLLALSTGAGKTVIFCYITERSALKNNRVYILVHRQELVSQTSEHLERLGVVHGIIAPGHSMTGDMVQVASVQTLARRVARVPYPSLIILDEAHHTRAGTWEKILTAWPKSHLLGVTATPCRMDGSGLGKNSGGFFDCLIQGPNIVDLIGHGHLAPPIVYAPPSGLDLSGVSVRMGDYAQNEVIVRVDKPKITGCAIEHYQRLCSGAPAIAFCASVKHAEHVADEFNAVGISAAVLHGNLSEQVRKHRITSLGDGTLQVLTSCEIISEGTDIPIVTAAILLRPTHSLGLYLQQVGRALRPFPGKSHAIILDHVGNCMRHGLPDEIRSWSLDAKRKKLKSDDENAGPQIRQCGRCYAVYPLFKPACPQCGFIPVSLAREIDQVKGNLVQITKSDIEMMQMKKRQQVGAARTLDELIAVGRNRNYNPQWAYRVWNARKNKQMRIAV